MSTPPVLAKSYGNCAEYKPECIEGRQKQLFYVALVFTAIGIAGHVASFDFFTEKQIKSILANVYGMLNNITQEDVDEDQHQDNRNLSPNSTNFGISSPSFPRLFLCIFCKCCGSFLFHFFSITIVVVGILVVVFVKPWGVRFGVSAIFAIFSFLVFLSAVCSYKYVGPRGSPFTTVFRVLFAASANMFYKQPLDVGELYENSSLGETTLLPHTNGLRYVVYFLVFVILFSSLLYLCAYILGYQLQLRGHTPKVYKVIKLSLSMMWAVLMLQVNKNT